MNITASRDDRRCRIGYRLLRHRSGARWRGGVPHRAQVTGHGEWASHSTRPAQQPQRQLTTAVNRAAQTRQVGDHNRPAARPRYVLALHCHCSDCTHAFRGSWPQAETKFSSIDQSTAISARPGRWLDPSRVIRPGCTLDAAGLNWTRSRTRLAQSAAFDMT